MINKTNLDIRAAVEESKLKLWQVAAGLKISDTTLSRRLRREFSVEEKENVFAIIEELSKQN